jgi:hypothetical protein
MVTDVLVMNRMVAVGLSFFGSRDWKESKQNRYAGTGGLKFGCSVLPQANSGAEAERG